MPYNGGFPATYQQMYYQQYPQVNVPQQNTMQNNGLVWVQGESGAKSYMVPANGTVLLMDSESDQFFLKSTDASGMPLPLRVFRYSEVLSQPREPQSHIADEKVYVTKDEFEKFKREMAKMMEKEQADEQLTL